jgi:hypothetical protein
VGTVLSIKAGSAMVRHGACYSHSVTPTQRSVNITERRTSEAIEHHQAGTCPHLARQRARQGPVQEISPHLGGNHNPYEQLTQESGMLGVAAIERADVHHNYVISAAQQLDDFG